MLGDGGESESKLLIDRHRFGKGAGRFRVAESRASGRKWKPNHHPQIRGWHWQDRRGCWLLPCRLLVLAAHRTEALKSTRTTGSLSEGLPPFDLLVYYCLFFPIVKRPRGRLGASKSQAIKAVMR